MRHGQSTMRFAIRWDLIETGRQLNVQEFIVEPVRPRLLVDYATFYESLISCAFMEMNLFISET